MKNNDRFKILVTGLIGSIYTETFIESLKKHNNDYDIDVLDMYGSEALRYKKKHYVNKYYSIKSQANMFSSLPFLRILINLYRLYRLTLKMPAYTAIQLHFASPVWYFYLFILRGRFQKLVISIWGSDFYRADTTNIFIKYFQRKLFLMADLISFGNPQTLEDFSRKFPGNSSKLRLAYFGSPNIQVIDDLKMIKTNTLKQRFGVPSGSIVVTLGYNGSPHQQHEEIVKSLMGVREKIPSKVLFLIPITYGGTKEYIVKIHNTLKVSNLNYKIITEFMSEEEVAVLRLSSDIFIHLQTTDSFSSSMREHFYAENIIITGDWLPYTTLDEKGVFMLKVSSVDEVGEKLIYAIENLEKLREKCKNNSKIIWDLSSWDKNIHSWLNIYSELM